MGMLRCWVLLLILTSHDHRFTARICGRCAYLLQCGKCNPNLELKVKEKEQKIKMLNKIAKNQILQTPKT